MSGKNFWPISSLFVERIFLMFSKRPMLYYNWIFGCHGSMWYVILINAFFCMIHSIINVQISCFILRHVTQKRYVVCHGGCTLLTGISIRNILNPTRSVYVFRFKCYGSNSGFHVFGSLDLDLWPMLYFLSHALGMMYWNPHANLHRNPSSPVLMGDMLRLTFWKTPYAL